MKDKEILVDEDLPPFFDSVSLEHGNELLKMDDNFLLNFNISTISCETQDALQFSKMPSRPIVGTPFYKVLQNQTYRELFGFISP